MKGQKSNHFAGRGLVSAVLSFLLSLFLSFFVVLMGLQCTVMSPGFLKRQIQDSLYASHLIESVEDHFVSYGMASNFDEAFFQSVLDEKQFEQDILAEAATIYSDQQGFDAVAYEEALYLKLVQNVQERGYELTAENEEAVRYLAQECTEVYQKTVSLPIQSQLANILNKMKAPIQIALIVDTALLIFTVFFLFVMYRRKYKSLAYITYALSGSALLIGIPGLMVLLSGKLERLAITSQALYELVLHYVRGILFPLLFTAALLLVLSIVSYIVHRVLRKRFIAEMHPGYSRSAKSE